MELHGMESVMNPISSYSSRRRRSREYSFRVGTAEGRSSNQSAGSVPSCLPSVPSARPSDVRVHQPQHHRPSPASSDRVERTDLHQEPQVGGEMPVRARRSKMS